MRVLSAALIPSAFLRRPALRLSPGTTRRFRGSDAGPARHASPQPIVNKTGHVGLARRVVAGSYLVGRLAMQPLTRLAFGITLFCASILLIRFIQLKITPFHLCPCRQECLSPVRLDRNRGDAAWDDGSSVVADRGKCELHPAATAGQRSRLDRAAPRRLWMHIPDDNRGLSAASTMIWPQIGPRRGHNAPRHSLEPD